MISDEIRSFVKRSYADEHMDPRELLAIADRVDRELVELPRDRDGATIHVGDTAYDENGMACEVVSFSFGRWSEGMTVHAIDGSSKWRDLMPGRLAHTAPDSFERIADELDEQAGSLTKDGYTWQEDAIHDFADRIRKLVKKEGEHGAD